MRSKSRISSIPMILASGDQRAIGWHFKHHGIFYEGGRHEMLDEINRIEVGRTCLAGLLMQAGPLVHCRKSKLCANLPHLTPYSFFTHEVDNYKFNDVG